MAAKVDRDVVDQIVEDVAGLYPDIDAGGLPIVGRVLRLAQLLLAAGRSSWRPSGSPPPTSTCWRHSVAREAPGR